MRNLKSLFCVFLCSLGFYSLANLIEPDFSIKKIEVSVDNNEGGVSPSNGSHGSNS